MNDFYKEQRIDNFAEYFAGQADLLAIELCVLSALIESHHFHPETRTTIARARDALEVARNYLLHLASELQPLTEKSAK